MKFGVIYSSRWLQSYKGNKVEKYTAIYVDSWMSGSHKHSLTRFKRFECGKSESVGAALRRLNIAEETVYLFVGWPKLQGEEDAPSIE